MTTSIDRFESAKMAGHADGHDLYRRVSAEGISALPLSQHVSKIALYDTAFGAGELNVDQFNGYFAGLAMAEDEVLNQGVRL